MNIGVVIFERRWANAIHARSTGSSEAGAAIPPNAIAAAREPKMNSGVSRSFHAANNAMAPNAIARVKANRRPFAAEYAGEDGVIVSVQQDGLAPLLVVAARLIGFREQVGSYSEIVEIGAHEAAIRIGRSAHDWLTSHVE